VCIYSSLRPRRIISETLFFAFVLSILPGDIGTNSSSADKVGVGMLDTHRVSLTFFVQIFDSNRYSGIFRTKDDTFFILALTNKEEVNLKLNKGEDNEAEHVE